LGYFFLRKNPKRVDIGGTEMIRKIEDDEYLSRLMDMVIRQNKRREE